MLNSKCFEDKSLQEAQDIFQTKRNGMIHMLIKRGAHLEQVLTLEYLCIDIIMLDLLSARRFAEKEMLVCKNGGKIKENRLYNYGFYGEDHLASNEPPNQLTFLRSSRHILTSTEY